MSYVPLVGQGFIWNVVNMSPAAPGAIVGGDLVLAANAPGTLTLPAAASYPGQAIVIVRTGTFTFTVAAQPGDTVYDGANTGGASLTMAGTEYAYMFVSNGINSWISGGQNP